MEIKAIVPEPNALMSDNHFLKDLPAVSERADGFLDELDDELKKTRLQLQEVDLSNLDEEERGGHEAAVHLVNRIYFHFYQVRERFLRKEITRDECIDLVNELIEGWATEVGVHPERFY